MNINTLALSLSVAFAAGSGSAMATTISLGDLNAVPIAVGSNLVLPGPFTHTMMFSLGIAGIDSTVGITIKDLPNHSHFLGTILDITNLSGSLFDSSNQLLTHLDFASLGMVGSPLIVDRLTLDMRLVPGAYSLQLNGMGSGLAGGLYSYALVAHPVPEPETWAMVLAGLGLVGFVLRRRNAGASRLSV